MLTSVLKKGRELLGILELLESISAFTAGLRKKIKCSRSEAFEPVIK